MRKNEYREMMEKAGWILAKSEVWGSNTTYDYFTESGMIDTLPAVGVIYGKFGRVENVSCFDNDGYQC